VRSSAGLSLAILGIRVAAVVVVTARRRAVVRRAVSIAFSTLPRRRANASLRPRASIGGSSYRLAQSAPTQTSCPQQWTLALHLHLIEADRKCCRLLVVDCHRRPFGKLGERDRYNDEDENGDVEQPQRNSTRFQTIISRIRSSLPGNPDSRLNVDGRHSPAARRRPACPYPAYSPFRFLSENRPRCPPWRRR